jgi:glycerol-3-phosphate dehydrogenase
VKAPADLAERAFDLLVVGGGINGAAIARDAALRGLSVCLVERNDWGWGTSAKSSKLAHGGLRYLELLEFGLVHEALQDRERFLAHAPHLVRPLRFLYPIYPHVAARRAVRAGLLLYDVLSHGKSLPNRRYLSRARALELAPGLDADGLTGGATFYDAQIEHVERLVVEMVCDARAHGAVCLSHTPVTALRVDPDGAGRRATGATIQVDGKAVEVRAKAVVNAAGCWVDDVLGSLSSGKPPKVRKTKGAHVVVPRFTDVALIVKARSDGRTFFILPWRDSCVIGTTDTDYEGDAGDAVADEEDVAYLLDAAARYFPDAPLDEIRYTYAGVRALVNEEGVTESNVTRRHILYEHGEKDGVAGLWSLQGGKITTARTLAEECVDRVARFLGRKDLAERHPTRDALYPGGPPVPWTQFRAYDVEAARRQFGLDADCAAHLVDTYGARWRKVLAAAGEDGRRRLHPSRPELACEVAWWVQEEDAATLPDALLRRSLIGQARGADEGPARAVADALGDALGWTAAERERQWLGYLAEGATYAVPQVAVPVVGGGVAAPRGRPVRRPAAERPESVGGPSGPA